jgi:CRISPR-associated endonuclease/helicase Cas3
MADKYYAHSKEGKPTEDWHRLDDHLRNVAEMAREFAEAFRAGGASRARVINVANYIR